MAGPAAPRRVHPCHAHSSRGQSGHCRDLRRARGAVFAGTYGAGGPAGAQASPGRGAGHAGVHRGRAYRHTSVGEKGQGAPLAHPLYAISPENLTALRAGRSNGDQAALRRAPERLPPRWSPPPSSSSPASASGMIAFCVTSVSLRSVCFSSSSV